MWTLIRWLLQEQSELALHCLSERLLNHFSRQQKKTTFSDWCFKGKQGLHRLEKYLNIQDCLENKTCLEKYLQNTQRP